MGINAFLHESGIHQHGVMSERTTYEIMTSESVGIQQNSMVLGKHSGRHAFEARLIELGYKFTPDEANGYFETFKSICDKKKTVSDSDLEAIVTSRVYEGGFIGGFNAPNKTKRSKASEVFGAQEAANNLDATNAQDALDTNFVHTNKRYLLENFDVHCGKESTAVSVITLSCGSETFEEVSLGDGPVDAAYNAIDKIVVNQESALAQNELASYSINSTSDGKDSLGEVVVKLRSGEWLVTGHGLSTDIIESSILAYLNAINKLLQRH